jgi:hypothetical protein
VLRVFTDQAIDQLRELIQASHHPLSADLVVWDCLACSLHQQQEGLRPGRSSTCTKPA